MSPDAQIALERVQSEALGALMSIQSYRDIDAEYFDRLRNAVANAAAYFRGQEEVPPALTAELTSSAQILRNEASAFPGREPACGEMADWLENQARELASG